MPTAVERLLFLKLAQFDDFADFIGAHEQTELAGALLKIDSDFLQLSSASGDAFLKIEHDPSFKHDVDVIADSFFKIARQFDVMATVGGTLGHWEFKFASTDLGDAAADFIKLDSALKFSGADLKILGSDFIKLDTSPDAEAFQLKIRGVGEDFFKLSTDMAADGSAFKILGGDFLKLAGGNDEILSPLDLAYKELGGELQTVGARFDTLSLDFIKLDEALGGQESEGGSLGTALMTLDQDFIKLDTALADMGDAAIKLFGGIKFSGLG